MTKNEMAKTILAKAIESYDWYIKTCVKAQEAVEECDRFRTIHARTVAASVYAAHKDILLACGLNAELDELLAHVISRREA